ncbi:ABC transporter permease [Rhizobium sp. FKY42]|uniref:ABC transporter permease n=1 Tax=Rhizobium sp. FKY42 TaxID=2562310 RepID=UPI0010BF9082|nr:ABC transporter permease [Rhizobium sp. FKY42]
MQITSGIVFRTLFGLGILAFLARPEWFESALGLFVDPNMPVVYRQGNLFFLLLQHLALVLAATTVATLVAITAAIFVTRSVGIDFMPLSRSIVSIGQTFPPVAVLALCVPVLGFGNGPTLVALILYGLLPIFENALTALRTIDPAVLEAARGSGMSESQKLMRVEMPLAMPLIISGIRLSAVISVATATIGSTVAAKTLGEVIVAGLQSYNYAFILQGGVLVAALALLIHDTLMIVELRMQRLRRPVSN